MEIFIQPYKNFHTSYADNLNHKFMHLPTDLTEKSYFEWVLRVCICEMGDEYSIHLSGN